MYQLIKISLFDKILFSLKLSLLRSFLIMRDDAQPIIKTKKYFFATLYVLQLFLFDFAKSEHKFF